MGQFSPAVNDNTNGGAEACLIGKKTSTTSSAAEGTEGDTGEAAVEAMPESSAEQQAYKNDPFTIRNDHYVGHDGFVVPKDFEEFYQRFPDYVAKWVRKHAERFSTSEDIEDWTQDLLLHLCHLSEHSKHLKAGKKDVVQTFDPMKRGGANQARFWDYINHCLANRFSTMRSKRMKDALCRPANLSLDGQTEGEDLGSVCDEYCHSHSERLREAANRAEKQVHDTQRVQQFEHFIWRNAPTLLPVCRAIKATRNYAEAAALLGLTAGEFNSKRYRIVRLGKYFLSGEPVPKQRRSYKKRKQSTARRLVG